MNRVIKIVESLDEYDRELLKKIEEGRLTKAERSIVMTPETFSKVFSPERLKLLRKIKQNHIKNIYQLAKELDKPYEVVFRNIKYLKGLGLVKIKDKDNKKIPCMTAKFTLDMFSDAGAEA